MTKKEILDYVLNNFQEELDSNDFSKIYDKLVYDTDYTFEIGLFTECLFEVGINPLKYMNKISNYFLRGSSITRFDIPDGIESIGDYAFYDCTSLKEVNIPNSVKSIGGSAFTNCKSLTKIDIPNGVNEIDRSAFYDCESLKEVNIPDSVKEIVCGAFAHCTSLTKIDIPNSVTIIYDNVFYHCTSLEEVNIPKRFEDDLESISIHTDKVKVNFI